MPSTVIRRFISPFWAPLKPAISAGCEARWSSNCELDNLVIAVAEVRVNSPQILAQHWPCAVEVTPLQVTVVNGVVQRIQSGWFIAGVDSWRVGDPTITSPSPFS